MKNMKKLFTLILAIALLAVFAASAFAATITVNPAVNGQEYKAYKIFDVTKTGTGDDAGYAYTINSSTSEWWTVVKAYADVAANGLNLTLASGVANVYNVSINTAEPNKFDAAAFAAALNLAKSDKTVGGSAVAAKAVGEEIAKAAITVGSAGYYFVDSSLGALCALNTAADTITIIEKNGEPGIKKEVQEGQTWGSTNDAAIGDTVNFRITVTAGGAADTTYVVHEKMSTGLTLNASSIAIKVNDVAVADTNYTLSTSPTDGDTFDITFTQAYTASLAKNTAIVITYSAILNQYAVTTDTGNTNEATLDYGNTSSVTQKTITKTYEFDLVKTDDEDNVIGTATFELYNALTGGNKIALVKNGDGTYRPATAAEQAVSGFTSAVIEAGVATIIGLDNATYYLEELSAPAGYTLLEARVAVPVTGNNSAIFVDDAYSEGGIQVVNLTGALLPTTGGIGTTIFYTLGGALVVGALVLLVTRGRMKKSMN